MNFSSHKFNDWLAERRWRMFWRCLPALLAMSGALLVLGVVIANDSQRSELRLRYRRTATSALAARNFETARVACLRGLSFDSDEQTRLQWLFNLSIALNGLGRGQEAAALLVTAAPEDHPGYVQAHVTVAQMLLNSTNITEAAVHSAERQLQNAHALEPQSMEINEMLGRFYINTGKFDEARKLLLEVYPVKKNVALLLAITYSASHDPVAARTWSNTAIEVFAKNLKQASPIDSPVDRMGLAEALSFQGNYQEALNILESGLPLSTNRVYGLAIADVCATWAAKLPITTNDEKVQRYNLVQEGISHSPLHPKLWSLLLEFLRPAAVEKRDMAIGLAELLPKVKDPTLLHYLLCLLGRARGDFLSARAHLEKAYRLSPELPAVANDMAMQKAFDTPEDLAGALAIIQSVLNQHPDAPAFRDTRGHILVKLGRYRDAVLDLEYALPYLQPATETHRALAAAYKGLGEDDLSAKHERLALLVNSNSSSASEPK